jgi:hypothetical protein
MIDNSRAINRIFTRSVISDLLRTGSNDIFDYVVRRYIDEPDSKTHGEIISEIYTRLGKEHRNEYYYRNTLLNKLLIGIHSVNTTTALSQVHIGKSIADFVMINGEGRVYEIKSDLDNFNRLEDQLRDYYRAFSKVSVLASERDLEKIRDVLESFGDMGNSIGIYVLTARDTIFSQTLSKEPVQFNDFLDYACIFKLLRKYEYENVLTKYFGKIPQADQVFHFRVCFDKFCEIPILMAQDLAFNELKKRNKISKAKFDSVQNELKSVVYFSGLARYLPSLEKLLQTNYRG